LNGWVFGRINKGFGFDSKFGAGGLGMDGRMTMEEIISKSVQIVVPKDGNKVGGRVTAPSPFFMPHQLTSSGFAQHHFSRKQSQHIIPRHCQLRKASTMGRG
jgi:hypothetical protein